MSDLVVDPIVSVSGNDLGNKLDNISFQLDTLSRDLGVSGQALELRGLNDSNQLEGYCVRTGRGEWCYIPVDKVQYFSVGLFLVNLVVVNFVLLAKRFNNFSPSAGRSKKE